VHVQLPPVLLEQFAEVHAAHGTESCRDGPDGSDQLSFRSCTREELSDVKYLLLIHMNPDVWKTLTQADIDEVMAGHEQFIKTIVESGEMVRTDALGQPQESAVVRIRAGAQTVTDGPYVEAKEFLAGFYIVDVASRERAVELAAMIPDAKWNAIELRPIVHTQEA
jgi:hypothetical protein